MLGVFPSLKSGLNIPVIQNKYVPYNNVNIDFIEVNGNVTTSEMQGNTKSSVTGIQFTDRHNSSITNTYGGIYNCKVHNCGMGIIYN